MSGQFDRRPTKLARIESRSCVRPSSLVRRRPALGFTIVELLLVIAIMGILGAVLLPSLARAKISAKRTQCFGNLHQLGLAAQLYWDDHDGRTFRYRMGATNNGVIYWFGWIEDGAEGARAFDLTQGALWPYLRGRGVEMCAALNRDSPQFKPKANGATYGYGYNLALSALPSQPAFNLARLMRPSDATLFADAAQVNDFQPPASPDHPLLEEFYYVSSNPAEATAHFRHAHQANVAFCDGHIGREKALPGSEDTRMPGELLGRLRDEILTLP
jgi:prepilin-type processing-associated H-X9-DG protein